MTNKEIMEGLETILCLSIKIMYKKQESGRSSSCRTPEPLIKTMSLIAGVAIGASYAMSLIRINGE